MAPLLGGPRSSGAPVYWTAWTPGSYATDTVVIKFTTSQKTDKFFFMEKPDRQSATATHALRDVWCLIFFWPEIIPYTAGWLNVVVDSKFSNPCFNRFWLILRKGKTGLQKTDTIHFYTRAHHKEMWVILSVGISADTVSQLQWLNIPHKWLQRKEALTA